MTASQPLQKPPVADAGDIGLFLDVDGTLLDFADTPDGVFVSDDLRSLLAQLQSACDGALALVSGRSLASLDGLFGPLNFSAAGSHGLEIREAGQVHCHGDGLPAELLEELQRIADATPGSLLERKTFGAALHYRRAPDHGERLTGLVRQLHKPLADSIALIEGDHVLELTPASGDKGSAIRFLCQRPPWQNRQPVFIGDDTTDEAGFAAVNDMGGLSIRVGARRDTAARWQLDSTTDVQAWLRSVLAHPAERNA